MRGEICDHCIYRDVPSDAVARHKQQAPLITTVEVPDDKSGLVGLRIFVDANVPPEQMATMIKDPTGAENAVQKELCQNPCDYVKTGHCALADFAVYALFNKPL